MTAASMRRRLDTSLLLALGFRAWGWHALVVLPVGLVLGAGFLALASVAGLELDTPRFDVTPAAYCALACAVGALGSGLVAPWLTPTTTGRARPWRDALRANLRALPHLLVVAVILGGILALWPFAVAWGWDPTGGLHGDLEVLGQLGLILGPPVLLAPFVAMFALAPQVAALEGRNAFAALGRSATLTRRNWTPVLSSLALVLVLIGIGALLGAGVVVSAELGPSEHENGLQVVAAATLVAFFTLPGAAMTAAHSELTVRGGSWSEDLLRRIFE